MAAFWFLKYIPISLTNLFSYCSFVTIAVLLYFGIRKKKAFYPTIDRESIFVTIQRKNTKEVKKDLTWFLDKKVKMSWQ
jgi:hypothetical protein